MKQFVTILTLVVTLSTSALAQNNSLESVFILNEGNFNAGNATLTYFEPSNSTTSQAVFLTANSTGLGDVGQSLAWINKKIFAVINNSGKVVVIDPDSYAQVGQISLGAFSSPREIVPVSETKAYVTDLYGNKLYIVDLDDYSISSTEIAVGLNPDQMLYTDNYLFVANNGFGADSSIMAIDPSLDQVIDTIYTPSGPAAMHALEDGSILVVCTGYAGDYDDNWQIIDGTARSGGLYQVFPGNPDKDTLLAELPSAGNDLIVDESIGKVYVNAGGIREFDLNTSTMAEDTLIKGSFYTMAYDEVSGTLYLGDAKDYSSAGEITTYDGSGNRLSAFSSGIIPGDMLMVYSDMIHTSAEYTVEYSFELYQNYPNPFNPSTTITYSVTKPQQIRLEIFDITGRSIAVLANDFKQVGTHQVRFDASSFASGLYFYKLSTEEGSVIRKMQLIK